MLDLLIQNGTIIDGTGKKRYAGDIGVRKGVITEIGSLSGARAKKTVDATGKIISPGFIDILNHSDGYLSILNTSRLDSMIMQGVTTILVGHFGSSLAPLGSSLLNDTVSKWSELSRNIVFPPRGSTNGLKSIRRWTDISGLNIDWTTVKEYLKEVERIGVGVNVGTLIGHSTVRRNIVQDEQRELSLEERQHFKKLIIEGMNHGAFGLSFGLQYAHSYYVPMDEIVELSSVVKHFNGKIYLHVRNVRENLLESVDEAIEIARSAGVGIELTHLKATEEFNDQFVTALEHISQAQAEGIEINFDFYPYQYSWSVLYTYLPEWAFRGSREDMLDRLNNQKKHAQIVKDLTTMGRDLSNITIAHTPFNPSYVGKKLSRIAELRGISNEEALLEILKGAAGHVICFDESESKMSMQESAVHPLSMVSTGGAGYSLEYQKTGQLVHPRCFGTFPRFIAEYVRKQKIITLEKAIQKITSIPALKIGISDRGFIDEGMKADLVVFDENTIQDFATFSNPFVAPRGIDHVVINGQLSYSEGELASHKYGHVLTR